MPFGQVCHLCEFFSIAGPTRTGYAQWATTLCGKSQTPHSIYDLSAIGQTSVRGNIIHALMLTQAQAVAIGVKLTHCSLLALI
jgi:hypothetical protein